MSQIKAMRARAGRHRGGRGMPGALAAPMLVTMLAMWLLRPLNAQTAGASALDSVINRITATDVARHVGVLTQDSMRERDTPSPSLERTARYVADQFTALGLQPLASDTSLIQRYTLPGRAAVDSQFSHLTFSAKLRARGHPVLDENGDLVFNIRRFKLTTAAIVANDTVLDYRARGAQGGGQGAPSMVGPIGPAPVVVAGPHTVASVQQANLHDKVVVYVPPAGLDSTVQCQVIRLLAASNHVLIVADEDSVTFAARRRAAEAHPPVVLDRYLLEAEHLRRWAVYVWAPAIESSLAAAGFDLAEARTALTPIVREVSAVARLQVTAGTADAEWSAPNTVGVLPGTASSSGAVVLTAHMDEVGPRLGPADNLGRGADDNTSGVAGLLVLAKAFVQGARETAPGAALPRRTLVFAAVSGGAKAAWGSSALAERATPVLDINLDQIGRVVGDSVQINGVREVELALPPAWVAAQHPELRLTVVDGGSVVMPESDHFAFVRKAVPALYVHGGIHGAAGAAATATDTAAATVDADAEARLLRFVYALTQAVATAPRVPQWTTEGRQARGHAFDP